MTSWALDFESRDYRFLARESGILPTLQAMVTLTNTASLASSTLGSLDDESSISQHDQDRKEMSATAMIHGWTPWSLENITEGFMQVMRRGDVNSTHYFSWGGSLPWHKGLSNWMQRMSAVKASCSFVWNWAFLCNAYLISNLPAQRPTRAMTGHTHGTRVGTSCYPHSIDSLTQRVPPRGWPARVHVRYLGATFNGIPRTEVQCAVARSCPTHGCQSEENGPRGSAQAKTIGGGIWN